jgi:hypothetical protein
MWCTGEECCRDRDDRLLSLFILVAMVNASVDDDDDEENRHTGGVGSLPSRPSIEGYGRVARFTTDRSACSFVHEKKGSS